MIDTPDWLIALAMLCCVRLPLEILKYLEAAEPRDWPGVAEQEIDRGRKSP